MLNEVIHISPIQPEAADGDLFLNVPKSAIIIAALMTVDLILPAALFVFIGFVYI